MINRDGVTGRTAVRYWFQHHMYDRIWLACDNRCWRWHGRRQSSNRSSAVFARGVNTLIERLEILAKTDHKLRIESNQPRWHTRWTSPAHPRSTRGGETPSEHRKRLTSHGCWAFITALKKVRLGSRGPSAYWPARSSTAKERKRGTMSSICNPALYSVLMYSIRRALSR